MKILKHKNIMGIIYSLLLLMPIAAIAVRSAYVVVNKNAYQSYSGNKETLTQVNSLTPSLQYKYEYIDEHTGQTNNTSALIPVSYVSRSIPSDTYAIRFTDANKITCYNSSNSSLGTIDNANGTIFTVLNTASTINLQVQPYYKFYSIDYVATDLDNVFEYSVNKFISENNLGQINMFSWFTNLFLSDNATNNLYVGFANWYMNYAMLISCMHLLFLVLMWFVNYSRRLLDRGMNYDW